MIEAVDKYIIEIQDVFKTCYVKISGYAHTAVGSRTFWIFFGMR